MALQLGGSDPHNLATCAKIGTATLKFSFFLCICSWQAPFGSKCCFVLPGEDFGYDEINLNVGCPSKGVKEGCFGAVLMKDPFKVAKCIKQMKESVSIPVTIKNRIGNYVCICSFVCEGIVKL